MSATLTHLKDRLADVNALRAALSMMEWDQQTFMPKGGAEARAEHSGILSRMAHEIFVHDQTRRLLDQIDPDSLADEDDRALVRVVRRDIDLSSKIPTELVEEKSKLAAQAHEAWVQARRESNFAGFAPILERMFEIAREEAEHLGYEREKYDALLDQYEEGSTAEECRQMFATLKERSVPLVRRIADRPQFDDSFLHGQWDQGSQRAFTEMLVRAIGFDMNRGRQDTAPHPFCGGWSVNDVRLTTRFKDYLPSAIFGSLHEAGHGVYEQGSPTEWDRTMLAGGVSLGLHESQSRLWENIVGRSRPFWKRFLPRLQESFPALAAIDPDTFYRAINRVQPSYIRVEADELTYNLHVMIRFEIECDILEGRLQVRDLPEAWNAKYEEYLGIRPRNDAEGCLQDVHWSMGSIGYFPTYTMGNILSFQIWNRLQQDLGDTDALIEEGQFEPILRWLGERIYSKGRKYPPKDLVVQVTGEPMNPDWYLSGLERKYADVYGL
jgi:carboxypeptidase Taq